MSNINPDNIDGTFPVAGQDNDSQGFRDNFTNTKNNLIFAKQELEDLQAKAIFKANLTGTSLNNDMAGALIKNAQTSGFREVVNNIGAVSGAVTISFSAGNYHTLTTAGAITINSFINWPAAGNHARLRLAINVSNVGHTLTVPSTVSTGLTEIAGISSTTITFDTTGTHIFEFSTSDGGATIAIFDLMRNRTATHSSIIPTANVAYSLGSSTNRFNYVYANTLVVSTTTSSGSSATYTEAVTANTITANSGVYGTIRTAAQGNITSLGTLTGLTVSGNVTAGNVLVTGESAFTGSATLTSAVTLTNAVITPVVHSVIANANTTTLSGTISTQIIEPVTDPIGVATIQMPAAPANGHRITIGFGNTITSITHIANSGQILKGPLSGTVGTATFGTWVYYAAESTWYRIG